MNMTLLIGSLVIFACMGFVYWIYKTGVSEGANEQSKEDAEAIDEYLADKAPDFYSGRIGTSGLGVRYTHPWGKNSPANSGTRVERRNGNGRKPKE